MKCMCELTSADKKVKYCVAGTEDNMQWCNVCTNTTTEAPITSFTTTPATTPSTFVKCVTDSDCNNICTHDGELTCDDGLCGIHGHY
jgi:hypothetical protein